MIYAKPKIINFIKFLQFYQARYRNNINKNYA